MITKEEENQENEVNETLEETQSKGIADTISDEDDDGDFDSSAFVAEGTDVPGANASEDDSTDDEEDDTFSESPWSMDVEEEEEVAETEDEVSEDTDDEVADTGGNESTVNEILHKFQDLGIEAENVDELLQRVQGAIQDGELYQRSKYSNKNIENWKKALSLEDRDIVYKNYLAEGASEEEAESMTSNLENNNMLKDKSHDIRVAIRGSINRETDRLETSDRQKVATQQEAEAKAIQELKDHLQGTETMFGFKMGKPDQLDKVRSNHFEYIQSGKFFKEATSSPQAISEIAWFARHREQITKSLMNKGIQTGKEEILNEINNPSNEGSKRILTPDGNTEFNANRFVSE